MLNLRVLNRLQELMNELSEPLLVYGDNKNNIQEVISALLETGSTWQMINITNKDAANINENNADNLIKIFKKGKFIIQGINKTPELMHKLAKEKFPVCIISSINCKEYKHRIAVEGVSMRERYGQDVKPFTLDPMQLIEISRGELPDSGKIIKDIYMTEQEFSDYFNNICDNMSMFSFRINNDILKELLNEIANKIGEPINYSNISKSIGFTSKTIKSWVEALIEMNILQEIPSVINNPREKNNAYLTRIIKSEKLYFTDSNFAAYLLKKEDRDKLLENYTFEQIRKSLLYEENIEFYHYTDKDKKSIPLIIEKNGDSRDIISYEFKKQINPEKKSLFYFERKATSRHIEFNASAVIYLGDRLLANNDEKMRLFIPLSHI